MNVTSKRTAIGIVLNQTKDQVLLVKRRDVPIWVLPGGGIDPGETPEEAALREVWEETGLQVSILRQTALYTPINNLALPTYVYECTPVSGQPTAGDESMAVSFFPLNNLPTPFFFVHEDWLNDALKKLPEVIHKPLTQVTYFALFKYLCRHPCQTLRFFLTLLGKPFNSR